MSSEAWNKAFPNPHTRPDPADPLVRKCRADAKRLFGFDALGAKLNISSYVRELQEQWATPEQQARVASLEEDERQRLAAQADLKYQRQLERLSPVHVRAVLEGCDRNLAPITTPEIQRQLIEQWDGKQSVFLLGRTGIGKTYTATWAAMRAARGGSSVASTTPARICEASLQGLIDLRKTTLLVIDQLHTLRSPAGKDLPAWKVTPIIDLIDYRYEQMLTTLAAGTIGPESMVDVLGEDVRRRFPLRLASKSTEVQGGQP